VKDGDEDGSDEEDGVGFDEHSAKGREREEEKWRGQRESWEGKVKRQGVAWRPRSQNEGKSKLFLPPLSSLLEKRTSKVI